MYYYDVNSLDPYAMLMDMPVGMPTHEVGKNLKDIFGMVKAIVTVPDIPSFVINIKIKD